MLISFVCSLAGLMYIITLYSLFKGKLKFVTAKSRLFEYMLIMLFILGLTIITAEILAKSDNYIKLADILMKAHWHGVILIAYLCYYYMLLFFSNKDYKGIMEFIKTDNYIKVTTIILIILFIVSFFIPCTLKSGEFYNYLPGLLGIYINSVMALMVVMATIYLIFFNKNAEKKINKTVLIGFVIIFSIFIFFQLYITQMSFYGITFIAILFFLYATSENPDLEMINNLKKLNDEIVASNKAKTDIILNMSHDIRSPMNAIVNYSSELSEINELKTDLISNNVDNILVAGKNLLNIVDDILEMSGKDEIIGLDTYNLKSLVNDLKNITESRIGNKKIKLELNVDEKIPKLLVGNPAKLYRILMNILSNSAKYTEVGKIELDITGTKINNETMILHIKVLDTGFGIKEEDKPKVFSEYARFNDATEQNIEGTGLGIVNTKKNVEMLNGKIWFESTYGAGTIFYIEIPQKICDDKTLEKYNDGKEYNYKNLLNCDKLSALIVDDNAVNVNVTSRVLQKYNFKVDCSYSGNECIQKIKEGKQYDIIFMDLFMDNLNGENALKVLRYLNKAFEIPPIIALTANVVSGVREEYLKKGFDEYLAKPIDINELDRIINLFLKNKALNQQEKGK